MRRAHLPVFRSLLAVALLALPAFAHYDEIYDDRGKPRPGYREALSVYKKLSEAEIKKLERLTKKDFQNDNTLDLMPRVITTDEQALLRRGVEQRGTALRMFLQDYFAGNNRTIHRLIPKDVFDRIVERSGDAGFRKLVNPKSVSFPYGPDIMRAEDGSWRVIEDNHGYLGGMGDLIRARESLFKRMPEYVQMIPAENRPEQFYEDLVSHFREMAKPRGAKVIVYAIGGGDDHEDARYKKIFSELGVDYVSPYTKQKLTVDERGVWVISETGGAKKLKVKKERTRVGYMHVSGEPVDIDISHRVTYGKQLADMIKKFIEKRGDSLDPGIKFVLEDAIKFDPKLGTYNVELIETALEFTQIPNAVKKKLGKVEARGLLDAILEGKVATSYTPGLEFLGDKEFYMYVEGIIRHYLREEPILKNIPTRKFSGTDQKVDKALLNRVMRNPEKYVIKAVGGRGGDAVWVGPKIAKREFRKIRSQIEKSPDHFIVQEYMPLSKIGDKIGDIRGLALVDSKGVVASDSFFARGLPIAGDGKVNLSSKGREMAVLVIDPAKFKTCPERFSALGARSRSPKP